MLLSAAVLDAGEMKQRGFLNQVVAVDLLDSAVHVCTERMRPLAPRAARLNKQSFRALAPADNAQAATNLVAIAYRYADSPEHREGISAFTEKRAPRFIA
jgi:enoyl-CoA hydratase/carnithine racemase